MKRVFRNILKAALISIVACPFPSHWPSIGNSAAVNILYRKLCLCFMLCPLGGVREWHHRVKGMGIFKALDTFRTGVTLPSYRWELSSGENTCLGSCNKSLVLTWRTQETGGGRCWVEASQMSYARV